MAVTVEELEIKITGDAKDADAVIEATSKKLQELMKLKLEKAFGPAIAKLSEDFQKVKPQIDKVAEAYRKAQEKTNAYSVEVAKKANQEMAKVEKEARDQMFSKVEKYQAELKKANEYSAKVALKANQILAKQDKELEAQFKRRSAEIVRAAKLGAEQARKEKAASDTALKSAYERVRAAEEELREKKRIAELAAKADYQSAYTSKEGSDRPRVIETPISKTASQITGIYGEAVKKAQALKSTYEEIGAKLSQFEEAGRSAMSSVNARIEQQRKLLDGLREGYIGVSRAEGTDSTAAQKIEAQIYKAQDQLRKLTEQAQKAKDALEKAATPAEKVARAVSGVSKNTEKATKETRNYGKQVERTGHKSRGIFVRLGASIKSMLTVGLLYKAVGAIRRAISEATENIARGSERANKTLSSLSTSFLYAKNSVMAAFLPALEAITPVVTRVVDSLAGLFNLIGMINQELFGTGVTAVQAKKAQKDYAASIGQTGKAADKALLSIDELNKLENPSAGSGGSGGSGINPEDMFEEVELSEKAKAIAEKIREIAEAMESIKDNPAIKAIADALNFLWEKGVLPLANWLMEHPNVLGILIDFLLALVGLALISSIARKISKALGLTGLAGTLGKLGSKVAQWLGKKGKKGTVEQGLESLKDSLDGLGSTTVKPDIDLSSILEKIKNTFSPANPEYTKALSRLYNAGQSMANKIISGMSNAFSSGVNRAFSSLNEQIYEAGEKLSDGLLKGAINKFEADKAVWEEWAKKADDIFREINEIHSPSKLFTVEGKNIMDGLIAGMSGYDNAFYLIFNSIFLQFKKSFNEFREWLKSALLAAWTDDITPFLYNAVISVMESANKISNTFNDLKGSFNEMIGYSEKAWDDFSNRFQTNWNSFWSAISTFFSDVWSEIKSTFKTVYDWIGEKLNILLGGIGAVIEEIMDLFSGENYTRGGSSRGGGAGRRYFNNAPAPFIAEVPHFATGAAVYGDTLAVVGDNYDAASNPEIIAPRSVIEQTFVSSLGPLVGAFHQDIMYLAQVMRDTGGVELSADGRSLFQLVRREADSFQRITGQSAFTF